MRLVRLSKTDAEGFYAVHRERPFFKSLTDFMSSGAAIVMVLEAGDAIRKWRTLMGATDPAKADPGTLRKDFAESIERNATHGSDAPDTAAYEIGYFFAGVGLLMVLGVPFGRLPGDVLVRRGNFSFYFPLTTSIILSIVLTLLFALF